MDDALGVTVFIVIVSSGSTSGMAKGQKPSVHGPKDPPYDNQCHHDHGADPQCIGILD